MRLWRLTRADQTALDGTGMPSCPGERTTEAREAFTAVLAREMQVST